MDFFKDKNNLFCFSPEVMLVTFVTESLLAIYVTLRYRLNSFSRLLVATLLCLGAFQFAEYQVCSSADQLFWSRIGFSIITILPVLGLHLISLITKQNKFLKFAYVLMSVYIAVFLFVPKAINGAVCGGNYILFHTDQALSWTYSFYYFGFLILGIWEAIENMNEKNKNLLRWMIAGYGSFMIPMGVVYSLSPETREAIPSIMCGFALILAFILAFEVMPKSQKSN